MQNETCFLLSYIKYGDHDAILHCFCQNSGFQSYFVRGIYAAKNKKKAYLFPLNQINITFNSKNNAASLQLINKIEKGNLHYDFDDVRTNSILFFVSDFLNQILREETHSAFIFSNIELFLKEVFNKNYNAYIAFIFKILKSQGISPLVGSGQYLDPSSGIFDAVQNHQLFDDKISFIWKNQLTAENGYTINLDRKERNQTLQSLLYYYEIHFAGFYTPTSLSIIEQVFH